MKSDPLGKWPEFMEAVRLRMEQGSKAYGANSFLRKPAELAGEVEEELLDVCGWAFILWSRIATLRQELTAGEQLEQKLRQPNRCRPKSCQPAGRRITRRRWWLLHEESFEETSK